MAFSLGFGLSKGAWGERQAANHLKKSGYRILDRNWRWKRYELDLIARRREHIVFVEVKTRTGSTPPDPRSLINADKRAFLRSAAKTYLQKHDFHKNTWQFDVIVVLRDDDGRFRVDHYDDFLKL